MELARHLHRLVDEHPSFEAGTINLSITTFRYVPGDVAPDDDAYLNALNSELVTRVETSGEAFVSNAVVDGKFFLRACIVNFRTSMDDVEALPGIAARIGAEVHSDLRSRVAS
jgi:aromatic-L-amino-acid decarboxylase